MLEDVGGQLCCCEGGVAVVGQRKDVYVRRGGVVVSVCIVYCVLVLVLVLMLVLCSWECSVARGSCA